MKRKMKTLVIRLCGLLLVGAIGARLFVPPLLEKRSERRVRAMLLVVQEGLQRYHVAEELYPRKLLKGHELVGLLLADGHLKEAPANPWTGRAYTDPEDADWLRYRSDSAGETYELTVLYPGTEEVEFRLDTTKHQSLE